MANINLRQTYELALEQYRNGMLAEAADICLRILNRYPSHLNSLRLMGLIAMNSARVDLAIPYFTKAYDLAPRSHDLLSHLGEAHRRIGNISAAIEVFQRALDLNPGDANAHNNLGIALREHGRLEDALASFRRALAIDSLHIAARNNLGAALLEMGLLKEAAATLQELITHSPDNVEALVNLGSILAKQKDYDAAISTCREAISVSPDYIMAYVGLGNALDDANRLDEAIEVFNKALNLNPNMADVHLNLGAIWTKCGKLDEAISSYRRAMALSPDDVAAHSNLLLSLHYSAAQDARRIFEEHNRWNRSHASHWKPPMGGFSNERSDGRRLRVGYVSPDFRDHPVARFILPLLENHDRARFEIFCYSNAAREDAITGLIKQACDHWRGISRDDDAQVAEMIRADQIDILVDLAGHTARNRLLVFARKPAPVQVSFLGYPNTTGLEAMDYRISDELADPIGQTESLHSEKLIRLVPGAWCFHPLDEALEPSMSDPDGRQFTFCCFNNFAKVTYEMLALWGEILRAVPDSHLLLKSQALENQSVRGRVTDYLGEQGIAPERLFFRGHEPSQREHLACYEHADIALDTYPYHGTTTSCEALWMGVPVVTLAGETHVSRVGVSLLTNIGLQDMIARTGGEYVRIAAALANDRSNLAGLRASLRQRMRESSLMDAKSYAVEVETAFLRMWDELSVSQAEP